MSPYFDPCILFVFIIFYPLSVHNLKINYKMTKSRPHQLYKIDTPFQTTTTTTAKPSCTSTTNVEPKAQDIGRKVEVVENEKQVSLDSFGAGNSLGFRTIPLLMFIPVLLFLF